MKTMRLAVAFCVLFTAARSIHAERVDMPPEWLRQTATHIIVGAVTGISERKETDKEWATTYFTAEVRIQEVEKGESLKAGELVNVRYWHRTWIGGKNRPFDMAGHRNLPREGETLRIYLARNAYDGFGTTKDGGYNVIGANGFERRKT
jgi:hypothetical protein